VRPLGYHGKLLRVDLDERRWSVEEPSEAFFRRYGGGGLLATHYLLKETAPGLDAFDPESLLVVTSSVVAGHPYPGLARFTVAAKSPLTSGIGEARCEGPFAAALKASGVDAFLIRGAASRPVVMVVEAGEVSFHDASDLWGLTVNQSVDRLEAALGSGISTAVIGPAGERRVRFASVVSERTYQAARMGMGAVLGSKNLKAIAIRGRGLPPVADPGLCAGIGARYRERMRENPLTRWQLDPPGFSAWVHVHGTDAALCTRNYRDSVFEHASQYDPSRFLARYREDALCPGCPNNCIKIFATDDDQRFDPRAGGIHQEIAGALGPNLGIADPDFVLQANVLCNELGLDPASLGFTLSMAMECVERGLLKDVPLRFGDGDAALSMMSLIAAREGFGDVLAEGALLAAKAIGGDAPRYAMQVKGLEMVPFEPRTQTNLALGYAVAPFGPRYDVCEHDWDYDTEAGWPHTLDGSKPVGILERVPMAHLGEKKVRNFKALHSLWSGADALDLCVFAVAPTRALTLSDMAELLHAVTGWNASSYEILRMGERRLHLMRIYNLREGLLASDDTLPDRFFDEPISSGRWSGTRLDRARFHGLIRTYYRMMGWDDGGRPRYETLLDHALEWTVEEGHIGRI
jgi:aldehyde:ferredoxin oxidoreductase